MPPKALEKTKIDHILASLISSDLSDTVKLSIINDTNLKTKNMAFNHNYQKLIETGESIDLTEDYESFVIYLLNCVSSLKGTLSFK